MKKSFVAGLLIGSVLFGAVGTFAGQYIADVNPFPVKLNGEEVSLEGYNINGYTYFKLRDVASAVGGFDVDFKDGTIRLAKDGYVYPDSDAALIEYAKNNINSVANEELSVTYTELKFLIADVTGDGSNDLLALGIDQEGTMCQIDVYAHTEGSVQKIISEHCGYYNGKETFVTEYNGKTYLCSSSGSSATGFKKTLLKYEDGNWAEAHSANTVFDWETGEIAGYAIDGEAVNEGEYTKFNSDLEANALTAADFVLVDEL